MGSFSGCRKVLRDCLSGFSAIVYRSCFNRSLIQNATSSCYSGVLKGSRSLSRCTPFCKLFLNIVLALSLRILSMCIGPGFRVWGVRFVDCGTGPRSFKVTLV